MGVGFEHPHLKNLVKGSPALDKDGDTRTNTMIYVMICFHIYIYISVSVCVCTGQRHQKLCNEDNQDAVHVFDDGSTE